MAITEQTQQNTYNPDGVVTVFAYTFCCFDSSEIIVYADDALVSSSSYTVSGVGTRSGGSVTFTTAPASSITELLIKLVPNLDRDTDFQQNGPLSSSVLDDDLDRIYSILQYQQSQASRTLTFSDSDATNMEIAGDDTDRADKLLGFDGDGLPSLYVPADLSAVSVITAFAETLLDDADSATARATLETVKNNREQEGIRYDTAGTAPTYTLTTASPAVGTYATGLRLTAVVHSTGTTGSNTINVNGLGVKNLKQYDGSGNKRSGVLVSGQVAVIEYDGTDFVILNPLPIMPLSDVRQVVQGGPITSGGLPDFLPSTDADLTLTTQNITSSVPFVVCASQGYGLGSDRIASAVANFNWTITDSATNYLYVDVGTDGTFTTGVTTSAPVFQKGGTAAVTSGLHTFDYRRMVMYVGNGSTTATAWRVFVGEAVASGGAVTSTVAYAYNGTYENNSFAYTAGSVASFSHNIGAPCTSESKLECITTQAGWPAGAIVETHPVNETYGVKTGVKSYKTGALSVSTYYDYIPTATGTAAAYVTPANWKPVVYIKRIF